MRNCCAEENRRGFLLYDGRALGIQNLEGCLDFFAVCDASALALQVRISFEACAEFLKIDLKFRRRFFFGNSKRFGHAQEDNHWSDEGTCVKSQQYEQHYAAETRVDGVGQLDRLRSLVDHDDDSENDYRNAYDSRQQFPLRLHLLQDNLTMRRSC